MGIDVRHRDRRAAPRSRSDTQGRRRVLTILPGFLGKTGDFASFETPLDVLLGYSMGGRFALEMLIAGAEFDRAVIVSAGLNLEEGREERRARDEAWARRFESDPWDDVMRDWNA